PREYVGPLLHRRLKHVKAVQSAVPHDQHAGLKRAQKATSAKALTRVNGPETSIDDGVRARLGQKQTPHLGKSGASAPGLVPTEDGLVLGRVSQRERGAIKGHEASLEKKRAGGLSPGQRTGELLEERLHRRDAKLVAPVAEGTGSWHGVGGIRPEKAQALGQTTDDVPDGQ